AGAVPLQGESRAGNPQVAARTPRWCSAGLPRH
ncbi:MAG: hypothetical protein AVDCRST_MAG60-1381, partial [uncultured Nocardioides sp.]